MGRVRALGTSVRNLEEVRKLGQAGRVPSEVCEGGRPVRSLLGSVSSGLLQKEVNLTRKEDTSLWSSYSKSSILISSRLNESRVVVLALV